MTLNQTLETLVLRGIKDAHFILPSLCSCSHFKCLAIEDIDLCETIDLVHMTLLEIVVLRCVGSMNYILPSLTGCTSLVSLYISNLDSEEDCRLLASVLPRLKHLRCIHYRGDRGRFYHGQADNLVVVSTILQLTHLNDIGIGSFHLNVGNIKDDADTLLIMPSMTQLVNIELDDVAIPATGWTKFLFSLLSVKHTVNVKLWSTNIDGDSVAFIHNSPHFTVAESSRNAWNKPNIEFCNSPKLKAQEGHYELLPYVVRHYRPWSSNAPLPSRRIFQRICYNMIMGPDRKW